MLRILDFNMWSGLTYLGFLRMGQYGDESLLRQRRHTMLTLIRKYDPDVVCLHEVNPLPSAAREIAEALGMDEFHHPHLGGIRIGPVGIPWNLREGDAILAKPSLRLRPIARARLSGGYVGRYAAFHFDDATQILGVTVEIKGKRFPVFSTHWHAGVTAGPDIIKRAAQIVREEGVDQSQIDEALELMRKNAAVRLREANGTLAFINKHAHGPFILTGDFNAQPDTEEIACLIRAGLRDAFAERNPRGGATWNYKENQHHQAFYSDYDPNLYLRLNYTRLKQPHRLDYIFYKGKGLKLHSCKIAMKEKVEGVQASDHFGILAEFKLP
ncbi:MAG: endonuclease/exonuclease/phosphatase family protein [Leptospirales bacterium]|nr:endonuclease/exonuclease/phosphatase family protein [Leptospirales bacterium]